MLYYVESIITRSTAFYAEQRFFSIEAGGRCLRHEATPHLIKESFAKWKQRAEFKSHRFQALTSGGASVVSTCDYANELANISSLH